jgi:two-component system response regulator AtoC
MVPYRTLVVDDDDLTRDMFAEVLGRDGHEVIVVADGTEAVRRLEDAAFDLIISDIQMARMSGLDLLDTVTRHYPETPLILVTAYAEPAGAMDAMTRGAADYLTKPVDVAALRATIARALDRRQLQRQHRALSREVLGKRTMIGTSPAMIELYKEIAQVAPTHATVYVHGESGSGKELVARTIHERSRRAGGPFVAVNCAALTESLLESELFGHERGAFTGAQATRRGLFEEAAGGTLFLDEIGDISPKLQAQLLRVLQEGEVRRVGGNQPIQVDVRVITATPWTRPAARWHLRCTTGEHGQHYFESSRHPAGNARRCHARPRPDGPRSLRWATDPRGDRAQDRPQDDLSDASQMGRRSSRPAERALSFTGRGR